jgi:hypothetical protein
LDSSKKDAQKRLPEAEACKRDIEHAEWAMQHGRWDMARDHLTAATSRATQSVHLLLQRMRCYIHLEQYPEAVSDGASALKLDSSNIDAYQVRVARVWEEIMREMGGLVCCIQRVCVCTCVLR